MTVQKFYRRATWPSQSWLMQNGQPCWACLHELRVDFEVSEPSDLKFWGRLNLSHRNTIPGAIGWGVRASLRYHADGFSGMPAIPASSVNAAYYASGLACFVPGSKAAGNIESRDEHYATAMLGSELWNLQPGFYRLEHWLNAHSSDAPNEPACNGLVEVNQNRTATGALDTYWNSADPYSALFGWIKPASGEMI